MSFLFEFESQSSRMNRRNPLLPIDPPKKCVCVLVIGDIGRSPRMQYHSLSLAKEGFLVNLLGYAGSEVISDIKNNSNISVHHIPQAPQWFQGCPKLLNYFFKILWQIITILFWLCWKANANYLLVQNVPAIPSLYVCWLYCSLTGCNFVIDWHNYSYTILGLSHGHNHKIVKFCKWYEGFFGRGANAHLCVTRAMKRDLETKWGIRARTVYDRPAEIFYPRTIEESHRLFLALSAEYTVFAQSPEKECTLFTEETSDGAIISRTDRPALLVSSTSWTEDEDFGILLNALDVYDKCCGGSSSNTYPNLLCVITGKGPLKQHYCDIIKEKEWEHVQVCTPWLKPEDYPTLLASADLGVCLHTSSSGLDLPMKIVDMLGSGLPVLAFYFPCILELVKPNKNGMVFKDESELANQLLNWFKDFPTSGQEKREAFKSSINEFRSEQWHKSWTLHVQPVFEK